MKRSPAGFTFYILISTFLAGCVSHGDSTTSPVLKGTQFGIIEGVDDSAVSGTYHWLGVPFAAPPVGALRWKAPVDPARWTTTLSTKLFGNACVQYGRIYGPGSNNTYDATIGMTLNTAVGSEDCLYLNIWRPATNEVDLPVIVFIHGGSNVSGYTADPELVTELKVKPEENETSRSLKKSGADAIKRLKKVKGAEFDKAYIDNEVTYHQTVPNALNKDLDPEREK